MLLSLSLLKCVYVRLGEEIGLLKYSHVFLKFSAFCCSLMTESHFLLN